jgi:hypothetical protein
MRERRRFRGTESPLGELRLSGREVGSEDSGQGLLGSRRSGGIGRRASLRGWCPQGRGGSSPPSDTPITTRVRAGLGDHNSSAVIEGHSDTKLGVDLGLVLRVGVAKHCRDVTEAHDQLASLVLGELLGRLGTAKLYLRRQPLALDLRHPPSDDHGIGTSVEGCSVLGEPSVTVGDLALSGFFASPAIGGAFHAGRTSTPCEHLRSPRSQNRLPCFLLGRWPRSSRVHLEKRHTAQSPTAPRSGSGHGGTSASAPSEKRPYEGDGGWSSTAHQISRNGGADPAAVCLDELDRKAGPESHHRPPELRQDDVRQLSRSPEDKRRFASGGPSHRPEDIELAKELYAWGC